MFNNNPPQKTLIKNRVNVKIGVEFTPLTPLKYNKCIIAIAQPLTLLF